jgi:hypothetical protein
MNANGPVIKGVCVAERMQVGAENPNRGRALVPAGMNEAWRIFCHPGTKFDGVYECRAAPRASKASDGGPGLSGGTILSW